MLRGKGFCSKARVLLASLMLLACADDYHMALHHGGGTGERTTPSQTWRRSTLVAAATSAPPPPPPPITVWDPASLPSWCQAGPYALPPGALPYTTMTRNNIAFKLYHNAYWHASKWYAVLPPSEMNNKTLEEGLSVNTALIRLPVTDPDLFTDNLGMGFLAGTTLLVDFPFPAFPDNNGHWAEIMLPTYSVLANGSWADFVGGRSRHVDRVLLPNLRKVRGPTLHGVCHVCLGVLRAPLAECPAQPLG